MVPRILLWKVQVSVHLFVDFLQSLGEQGGTRKFWIEKLSIDLAGKLDSGELGFRRHFPKFQAMQELLQEQLGGP